RGATERNGHHAPAQQSIITGNASSPVESSPAPGNQTRGRERSLIRDLTVLHAADRTARRLSAEDLPVLRSATTSKATFCPSLRPCIPARSTALMCTNTSLPPSSGWMKPKPFWILNHFTVPCVI